MNSIRLSEGFERVLQAFTGYVVATVASGAMSTLQAQEPSGSVDPNIPPSIPPNQGIQVGPRIPIQALQQISATLQYVDVPGNITPDDRVSILQSIATIDYFIQDCERGLKPISHLLGFLYQEARGQLPRGRGMVHPRSDIAINMRGEKGGPIPDNLEMIIADKNRLIVFEGAKRVIYHINGFKKRTYGNTIELELFLKNGDIQTKATATIVAQPEGSKDATSWSLSEFDEDGYFKKEGNIYQKTVEGYKRRGYDRVFDQDDMLQIANPISRLFGAAIIGYDLEKMVDLCLRKNELLLKEKGLLEYAFVFYQPDGSMDEVDGKEVSFDQSGKMLLEDQKYKVFSSIGTQVINNSLLYHFEYLDGEQKRRATLRISVSPKKFPSLLTDPTMRPEKLLEDLPTRA